MNTTQIALVRHTFAQIEPIAPQAAALFYARLFDIAPDVRPLFKHDITEQGAKLMQMLGIAVANLDKLDELIPAVKALGARHVGYGVKPEDYEVVGAALLWTLEQGLGYAFTPAVKEAWAAVYAALAGAMQTGVMQAAIQRQSQPCRSHPDRRSDRPRPPDPA